MKLPAVWIACAFAAGIGLAMALARVHPVAAAVWIAAAVAMMLAGGLLTWRGLPLPAWIFALAAWFALGGAGPMLERASVPANHVTRLIAAGRLDTSQPLRWRGRLREDPLALPWGASLRDRSRRSGDGRRAHARPRRPARRSLLERPAKR